MANNNSTVLMGAFAAAPDPASAIGASEASLGPRKLNLAEP